MSGLKVGDQVQLGTGNGQYLTAAGSSSNGVLVSTATTANNLVGLTLQDNGVEIVRGTYNASANTFVGSATGADSLSVYDSNTVAGTTSTEQQHEAVVLVGPVAATGTGIGGAAGVVTLA